MGLAIKGGKGSRPLYDPGGGLIAGLVVIGIVVGLTACLAPPNNWDAMSYHLPRVVHWMQNRSVAFFPTAQIQQLFQPPLAEYSILHLHVLSGGDHFDGLIQWLAFCGSAIGVSLIADVLGASRTGQVLAAVICGTIPQGILSASGVKNDFVLTFWLICLMVFLLVLRTDQSWLNGAAIGSALGLACLTKGTAYIYVGPLVLAGLVLLGWEKLRNRTPYLLAALGLAIIPNVAQYARNASLFGSPLGPGTAVAGGCPFANGKHDAATVFSNLVRNVGLHLSTPSTQLNAFFERTAVSLLKRLDIDPSDPKTTFCGTTFAIPEFGAIEDNKANTFHLVLCLLAGASMFVRKWRIANRALLIYGLSLVIAALLFCLLLRWQPWHTRLHLPLFALAAPIIGVAAGKALSRPMIAVLGLFLLLSTGPLLFGNELRPLSVPGRLFAGVLLDRSRSEFYFAGRQGLQSSYADAARTVLDGGCHDVGIDSRGNSQIYPLLVFLGAVGGQTRVSETEVSNISSRYSSGSAPCAVICMKCDAPATFASHNRHLGSRFVKFQDIFVFANSGAGFESLQVAVGNSDPDARSGDLRISFGRQRARTVGVVEALVNSRFSGDHGCWIQCNTVTNALTLVNDLGSAAAGTMQVGSPASLSNSQCTLDGARSSVKRLGDQLIVELHVTMGAALAGPKAISVMAGATYDGHPTWETGGSWPETGRQ